MLEQMKKFLKDEEAPTAVEYGLMLAGIAVAIIITVFALGDHVEDKFDAVDKQIAGRNIATH
jgi:pilus assembly protein Flp/PilA